MAQSPPSSTLQTTSCDVLGAAHRPPSKTPRGELCRLSSLPQAALRCQLRTSGARDTGARRRAPWVARFSGREHNDVRAQTDAQPDDGRPARLCHAGGRGERGEVLLQSEEGLSERARCRGSERRMITHRPLRERAGHHPGPIARGERRKLKACWAVPRARALEQPFLIALPDRRRR